jgi:hypothetical protein
VDDTCTYGVGLVKGLLVGLILVGILILLYIVFAPLGNMTVNVIILLGGFYFILSIVLTIAYGYNTACLEPGGSTLLFGYIIPVTLALPALPECAGLDVSEALDDLANSPCGLSESLGSLILNGSCISCNSSGATIFGNSPNEFQNCANYGFPTFTSVIANEFYNLCPSCVRWLNGTCLVRGGCLFPSTRTNLANYQLYKLPKVTGVLSFLIPSNSYINSLQNTTSPFYQQNNTCLSYVLWPTIIAWFIILAFALLIIGYIVLPILGTVLLGIFLMVYRTAYLFYILSIKGAS